MPLSRNIMQWKKNKRCRGGAGILLAGVLLLFVECGLDLQSEKKAEAKTLQYVVTVNSGTSLGSGILYEKTEEHLVIATAAHILEPERGTVNVTFYDNLTLESCSYYVSDSSDLAFINIPMELLPNLQTDKYEAVRLDKDTFDQLQEGKEVIFQSALSVIEEAEIEQSIEQSQKGTILDKWIYVEDFQQYMMLLKGNIYPGMSGGGVFDQDGCFLGILCGANDNGEVAAVPLTIIQAEYAGIY